MKVADYRDLIGALSQAFTSLRSTIVPEESAREAQWVRRAARELMNADCPRAKDSDRNKAERLLDQTAVYLAKYGL